MQSAACDARTSTGSGGAAAPGRRGKRRDAEETGLERGGVEGARGLGRGSGAEGRGGEGIGHGRVGARAASPCVAVSLCAHARC